MTTLTKHPGENTLFDMDFSARSEIAGGQTITAVNSVTAERVQGEGSITIGATAYSPSIAQVRISGGSDGDLYSMTYTVTTSGGNILVGIGRLQVVDDPAVVAEATAIPEFFEGIRFWMGDTADIPTVSDSRLAGGVRSLVRSGLVKGYTLNAALTAVTPAVDADGYFLVTAKTALAQVSARPDSQSFATRGFKSSVSGAARQLGLDLAHQIYRCENGSGFVGWSNFATFLEGFSGVRRSWLHFVDLQLQAPFQTVNVSNGGVFVG